MATHYHYYNNKWFNIDDPKHHIETKSPENFAIPLMRTTEGLRAILSDLYQGTESLKEIQKFFKANCTIAGYSVSTCIDRTNRKAYSVMVKGKPNQKQIRRMIEELHCTEFHFSWAFSPSYCEIGGVIVPVEKIDWITDADVKKTFGII